MASPRLPRPTSFRRPRAPSEAVFMGGVPGGWGPYGAWWAPRPVALNVRYFSFANWECS